jgi:peptidoglycan/xylan/chitin deacetylase (PgdA/CDA1 family)
MLYAEKIKSGLRPIFHRFLRRKDMILHSGCAVLLYHRVTNLVTDPQLLSVSPEHFDVHMSYLKANYRVLTVEEFSEILLGKHRFPDKSVLVTFDDGYADNYLEALPILEKHRIQALFYVATGTISTCNEFWWDALERIVLLGESNGLSEFLEIDGRIIDLKTDAEQLYQSLLPVLRKLPSAVREEKLNQLAVIFNSLDGRLSHRALSWGELRLMHQSPSAVIGSHTHMHPSLGSLSVSEQENEVRQSKVLLERELGSVIEHFSYPFGTKLDFTYETIQICRNVGFRMVAANIPLCVNRKSNPFAFPRHLVRNWKFEDFKQNLDTFFR